MLDTSLIPEKGEVRSGRQEVAGLFVVRWTGEESREEDGLSFALALYLNLSLINLELIPIGSSAGSIGRRRFFFHESKPVSETASCICTCYN